MKVIITRTVLDHIEQHAEKDYPNECCGVFFGKDAQNRKITHAYRVNNSKEGDQSRRFQIAPEDYQKAESFALENDLDFLGIYHSHPDHPAIASEHDRKVAMPFFSYIIISVLNGKSEDLKSWQLNEERQFEEEEVEIQVSKEQTTE